VIDVAVLEAEFVAAGCDGVLHAREIDGDREIAPDADSPVVSASVFKVGAALEFFREAA
jgi:beta-lactamase class A